MEYCNKCGSRISEEGAPCTKCGKVNSLTSKSTNSYEYIGYAIVAIALLIAFFKPIHNLYLNRQINKPVLSEYREKFQTTQKNEPDFGPYMRELQRRIKHNWHPPKGNESRRIIVLFKVSKAGKLLSLKTIKSSGVFAADVAALKAVNISAPFRPLPKECKDKSVDIQFTFDYNVFLKGN